MVFVVITSDVVKEVHDCVNVFLLTDCKAKVTYNFPVPDYKSALTGIVQMLYADVFGDTYRCSCCKSTSGGEFIFEFYDPRHPNDTHSFTFYHKDDHLVAHFE